MDCHLQKHENILAVQWHDKRDVTMLSTLHKGEMVDSGKTDIRTGERILKPDLVVDYKKNTRLIDKADMMISFVECTWRTMRWYQKLFVHLLDVTLLNSYIIMLVHSGRWPTSLRQFPYSVAYQLLEKYGQPAERHPGRHPTHLREVCTWPTSRCWLDSTALPTANSTYTKWCRSESDTRKRDLSRVHTHNSQASEKEIYTVCVQGVWCTLVSWGVLQGLPLSYNIVGEYSSDWTGNARHNFVILFSLFLVNSVHRCVSTCYSRYIYSTGTVYTVLDKFCMRTPPVLFFYCDSLWIFVDTTCSAHFCP